jgi:hypothetical protein
VPGKRRISNVKTQDVIMNCLVRAVIHEYEGTMRKSCSSVARGKSPGIEFGQKSQSLTARTVTKLTNSTLLSADMILLCAKKNLYLMHDSHSLFSRKMCIIPQVRCHRPPIWPPALPLNLRYIWTVPSKLSLGSPLYTDFLRPIIHISCPYSIAWVVYPENPSRSEAL